MPRSYCGIVYSTLPYPFKERSNAKKCTHALSFELENDFNLFIFNIPQVYLKLLYTQALDISYSAF